MPTASSLRLLLCCLSDSVVKAEVGQDRQPRHQDVILVGFPRLEVVADLVDTIHRPEASYLLHLPLLLLCSALLLLLLLILLLLLLLEWMPLHPT